MQKAMSLIGSVAGLLAGVGVLVTLWWDGNNWLPAAALAVVAVVVFAAQCFVLLFRRPRPAPPTADDSRRELGHKLSSVGQQLESLRSQYQAALEDLAAQTAAAEALRHVLHRADHAEPKADAPHPHGGTSSRNMIARVTCSLRWLNCTRALQKFLGRPLGDVIGRPLREFVHPGDWPRIEQSFQETLASGEEHNIVFRLRPAGTADKRYVQMDVATRYDEAEAPQYFRCFLLDVTARMRAERALRRRTRELVESNKQLRQINLDLARLKESYRDLYHFAPVWYFSLDREGRMVAVNETMLRALGYRRRELLNQPYNRLLAPAGGGPASLHDSAEAECRWVKQDGTVIAVWIRSVPVLDEDGRVVRSRSAAQDVTERNRLANELRRRTDELEKVNRDLQAINKDLDHFNWTVAHDLKEPLRTLAATGGQVLRAFERHDFAACHGDLQGLVRTSLRLARLVDNLLTLSREGQLVQAPTTFALGDVLATVRDELADLIRRQHARVDLVGPAPILHGDAERVTQLLANLVANGLKYNADAAPAVEVGAVPPGEAEAAPPGMATVFVRDNGVGIDPQFHGQIFEKFERCPGAGPAEGTGVGLTICKRIVEAHGGTIRVQSRAGRGATFYFTLPQGNLPPAETNGTAPSAFSEADSAAPAPGRLLLVEDMDDLGQVARRLLEMAGHRVHWCRSAEQAWEYLQGERPDLVLLDINLPGMSGLDLCRRLRAAPAQAGLRVALFSQADQEGDVRTGLEAGADHVLSKELLGAPELLGRQLRTVLARPAPPAGEA
jgi:PAS domain S-box-containing protein